MSVHLRSVDPRQTHVLRQRVLRPHQAVDSMAFDGDDDPPTRHFAATDAGEIVGVVSLYRRPMPVAPRPGDWQLRGMAVDATRRRGGVGRLLLTGCLDHVRANGGRRLWCNARLSAAGFYEKLGLVRRGEVFDIAGIGPHVVMAATLGPKLVL